VSDRAELLAAIKAKAVIRGDFVLSSGQRADWYVDLRRILLDGRLAPLAGRVMLDLTADLGYDAVGGLTMGADPVATAMMHAAASRGTPVDAFVVRKREKEHGMQRRIEGPEVAGRRVLAVEDTSTTGASPLTAVEALREAGAEVVGVAVLVDRGARPNVTGRGLTYRAAYELADLGVLLAGPVRPRLGARFRGNVGAGADASARPHARGSDGGLAPELVLTPELAQAVGDEADDGDDQDREQDVADDRQPVADMLPFAAERVPQRGEHGRVDDRADQAKDSEADRGDAHQARDDRGEGADEGQHARHRNRPRPPALQEALGPAHVGLGHQHVAPELVHERPAADPPDRVRGVRAAQLGQRADDDDQGEVKVSLVGEDPGEAERDLGRDRDARRLQEAE